MTKSRLGMAVWAGVAMALLGGCGVSTSPLRVAVRDAQTRAAVVGAGVEVDSMAPGPSLKFGDVVDELLGKRGAVVERGVTDGRGEAVVGYVKGRSVRLTVVRGLGAPATLTMEPLEGEMGWTLMEGDGVEVRAGRDGK